MISSNKKHNYEAEFSGHVTFKKVDDAFRLLASKSIKEVAITSIFYTASSWTKIDSTEKLWIGINERLNDDCIMEILNHLDVEHLIYFSQICDRFKCLVARKLSKLRITFSTIGEIGLLNFAFIVAQFSKSVTEIHISTSAFRSKFGIYDDCIKGTVLQTILYFGSQLKKVVLDGFDLQDIGDYIDLSFFLNLLKEKNVEIESQ